MERIVAGKIIHVTDHSALSASVQFKLGKQLRDVYVRMLAEPLPPRFVELLSRLGKGECTYE
jgi:hypothetical protein